MRHAPILLLLLTLCVPLSAVGFSAHLVGGPSMAVSWDSRYDPRLQASLSVSATAGILFDRGWAIGIGASVHEVAASAVTDWQSYRGYGGVSFHVDGRIELWTSLGSHFASHFGLDAAVGGAFSRYSNTSRYFFHPALSVAPYLLLSPAGSTNQSGFRLSLPIQWAFRRDLLLSAAIGLYAGFAVMYRPSP